MTAWYEGRVAANVPAAAGLYDIHVDVTGTPLVGTHSAPGQYLRLAIEQVGEGIFAIASGPDVDGHTFELLVKGGSPCADALIDAQPGARVRLTAPEGPGFPLERGFGRRVLLFATGSGISAIRSLVLSIRRDREEFKDVTLYFGARSPDAFAYARELADWEQEGIRVVRTISQKDASGWEGLTGYVQMHLPDERLDDAIAFVCGQAEMVEGVKAALQDHGMPEAQIFQNV